MGNAVICLTGAKGSALAEKAVHHLANYPIPVEALDDRLGWIGTAGSGKTYNAGGGVERLLDSGARVVIVDPLDVWWGLRLTAAGKPSRFSLPIFGGEHGDLPLNEAAGKLIGETVANMTESCIVSLGAFDTKAAERRFMLAFLEAVYRHASGNPVHLIFDEADLWAPQNSSEPKLQSLMEQIVRRGRVRGFIPWLITQRPAVISKDVLSQVDGLVAFIAGYSHTSSGYTNPRGALKSSGLIEYPEPGRLTLTATGQEQADAPDAPPTGEELRRRVLGKLAGPQQRILSVLIEAYPEALNNEECAAKAGYSHTSSGYTNPRGNLKTLNLVGYPAPGQLRASDWLFP